MEWYIVGIYWYCWMGYTTVKLHQHFNCLQRAEYSKLKLSCSCLVLFLLWPLTLVMLEERLDTLTKWRF